MTSAVTWTNAIFRHNSRSCNKGLSFPPFTWHLYPFCWSKFPTQTHLVVWYLYQNFEVDRIGGENGRQSQKSINKISSILFIIYHNHVKLKTWSQILIHRVINLNVQLKKLDEREIGYDLITRRHSIHDA